MPPSPLPTTERPRDCEDALCWYQCNPNANPNVNFRPERKYVLNATPLEATGVLKRHVNLTKICFKSNEEAVFTCQNQVCLPRGI